MRQVWVDVSVPLSPDLTIWPGDVSMSVDPAMRIGRGDECNLSVLSLSAHTGTHVDAPWHFEDDGPYLHQVDTGLFFGDALVIEHPHARPVAATDLAGISLPARVLFKTQNSDLPMTGPFREDYIGITPDAAQHLVDAGVRLVGIDYLSIGTFEESSERTHHILLEKGTLIVEGLRLHGIIPGLHPFVVLPLPLVNADGAPCRAFIAQEPLHGS